MIEVSNESRSEIGSGSNMDAESSPDNSHMNQPTNPEWDCLLVACQKGDAFATRRILREHPSSKSHANPMGQSALHIAAWWTHVECVEVLLQSGADTQAVNSFAGATPLHECLQSNLVHRLKRHRRRRIECFSLLLQAKADPNALDNLGCMPLECFVLVDEDDVADHAEIEDLILAHEQATKNPLRALLQKLDSKEIALKDIDRLWFETVVPNLDFRSTCTLLSDVLVSMTEAWIDQAENTSDICTQSSTTQSDTTDHRYYLGYITWIWNKLVEIFPVFASECKDDEESFTNHLESVCQNTLSKLAGALFNRYELLYKQEKISLNGSSSLLEDDAILSSWVKLAILLVQERDDTTDAHGSGSSENRANRNELHQIWITIGRRDYLELAELWWDRFQISPIGVVNRQGMTPLQFAARSGHFRMVKWLISHPSLTKNDGRLLDWIVNKDQRGHTALAAAKANQHDQIAELLQNYSNLSYN